MLLRELEVSKFWAEKTLVLPGWTTSRSGDVKNTLNMPHPIEKILHDSLKNLKKCQGFADNCEEREIKLQISPIFL